ncbi:MAG: hypothetical protein ACRC92_04210 [Peptostreptococcaceae bacterium]
MVMAIKNSEVYKYLDKTSGLTEKIGGLVAPKNAIKFGDSKFHLADLATVERSTRPFTKKGLALLKKGKIHMFHDNTVSIGNLAPIIPSLIGGKPAVICNITLMSKVNDVVLEGETITDVKFDNPDTFEEMLASAYVVYKIAHEEVSVARNFSLRKTMFELYTQLVLSILNRGTGLATNRDNLSVVKYALGNFFTYGLIGLKHTKDTEDMLCNLAEVDNIEKKTKVEAIRLMLGEGGTILDLETLVTALKTVPQLSSIDSLYLIRGMTTQFGGPSVLSLDYIPYLAMIGVSSLTNNVMYKSKNIKTGDVKKASMKLAMSLAELL